MGENGTGIPFFDWMVKYLVALVPIGLGITAAVVAFVRRYKDAVADELAAAKKIAGEELDQVKDELREEIKEQHRKTEIELVGVRAEVRRMLEIQSAHIGEIAVLKVEQRNSRESIEEIKSITRETCGKVDDLAVKIAAIPGDLLNALRKLS